MASAMGRVVRGIDARRPRGEGRLAVALSNVVPQSHHLAQHDEARVSGTLRPRRAGLTGRGVPVLRGVVRQVPLVLFGLLVASLSHTTPAMMTLSQKGALLGPLFDETLRAKTIMRVGCGSAQLRAVQGCSEWVAGPSQLPPAWPRGAVRAEYLMSGGEMRTERRSAHTFSDRSWP